MSATEPTSADGVDELARVRRALAATQADLDAAIAAYKAFAYSVSHDLRAPLRAIAGFAGMLEETLQAETGADARHFLAIICDNARLLNSQIDGLLALSRIEHRELQRSLVNMTAEAQAVVEEMRQREPARQVTVRRATLPTVAADRDMMRVVLTELVGNAWKFTRERAEARVEIGAEVRDGARAYFVRDNGVGFSPHSVDRLFTVFRRLHGPKEYEGLGLGLATVRAVVARHRGRVWAECAPGTTGTTFWFSLPEDPDAAQILQPEP